MNSTASPGFTSSICVSFRFGDDPDVAERHHGEERLPGADQLADLDAALADDAVHGRHHAGVGELERHLVAGGAGRRHAGAGLLLGGGRGGDLFARRLGVLLRRQQLRVGCRGRGAGGVELLLADDAACGEPLVPVQVRVGAGGVGARLLDGGGGGGGTRAGGGDLRLGLSGLPRLTDRGEEAVELRVGLLEAGRQVPVVQHGEGVAGLTLWLSFTRTSETYRRRAPAPA